MYETWKLTEEEKGQIDTLYTKYEAYVKPKSNKVFARYKFQCRSQQDSESAEHFITELKTLVKDCGYEKSDEMVRDRIVCGTKHSKVKSKLLSEGSDLSLEKAIDIARSFEINQRQLSDMSSSSKEDPNINALRKSKPYKPRKPESQPVKPKQDFKPSAKPKQKTCTRCGYNHTGQQKCHALGKTCTKCKRKNHLAKMCMTKKDWKVHQIESTDDSDDDYDFDGVFVGTIECSKRKPKKKADSFAEKLTCYNTSIEFQLDTGAKCNVISVSDFKKTESA